MCLCYLLKGPLDAPSAVLLGTKHLGFGAGRVVGLGGHVDPGEDPWDATCREVAEESGLVVRREDLVHRAEVLFTFPTEPSWDSLVSVFVANEWRGQMTPSDEITPTWYPVENLPLELMWDDARYWLPQLLVGSSRFLRAHITFDHSRTVVADTDLHWEGALIKAR
jgi:8-oxo-dGTP diphosphatase